jgi:germination protein M
MRKMLKMPAVALLLIIPLLLSGCGLWGEEVTEIDPPQDVETVGEDESLDQQPKEQNKEGETSSETDDKSAETMKTELYLLDKEGLVAPQTLMLPQTVGVAKQSLQYLVKDGPVTPMLPNGFQAVLPAGTEVLGAAHDEASGTLTVNFSKEFKNYQPENEQKILEAITWTATQFDTVKTVKIQIEGVAQEVMPVNKTPIGDGGISRADGINKAVGNVVDVTGTTGLTLFYPAQAGDSYYYVPVTKRVDVDKGKITAAVESLIDGSVAQSGLLDEFGNNVQLIDVPTIQDKVVTLNFNEAIYSSNEENMISDEALNSLVFSLTAQEGIDKVAIKVNGKANLKNAAGEMISEPVSRPKQINTAGL